MPTSGEARLDGQHLHSAGEVRIRSVGEVLDRLDQQVRAGRLDNLRGIPTGFTPLDSYLYGGLHAGELLLVGGAQGLGKTTFALQMARHIAATDRARVLYLCYEHDEEFLLERLLAMESALGGDPDPLGIGDLRNFLARQSHREQDGLVSLLGELGPIRAVLGRIATYCDQLLLVSASGSRTTVEAIGEMARTCPGHGPLLVIVDYLQKVAVHPEPDREEDKVRRIVEGLKELAMREGVAMVAVVAADIEGLRSKRMRIHHLRGGSALMYEADMVLIMNDKFQCVARHHVVYQPNVAESFKNWIVFSLEKNRGGVDLIDFELRKRFAFSCFDPNGGFVTEQLVDERIYTT